MRNSGRIDDEDEGKVTNFAGEVARARELIESGTKTKRTERKRTKRWLYQYHVLYEIFLTGNWSRPRFDELGAMYDVCKLGRRAYRGGAHLWRSVLGLGDLHIFSWRKIGA